MASDWGGTPVEAWSSPDALSKCKKELEGSPIMSNVKGPGTPSVLWNAMIYPLLNMTIKGAVWYQGEANAGKQLPRLLSYGFLAKYLFSVHRQSQFLQLHLPCHD